jgi:hypothetical protein
VTYLYHQGNVSFQIKDRVRTTSETVGRGRIRRSRTNVEVCLFFGELKKSQNKECFRRETSFFLFSFDFNGGLEDATSNRTGPLRFVV